MKITKLFDVSQSERNEFCAHIIESSSPNADYYFLVLLSTLIVVLGLLGNNVVLMIGGMLVTPILSPLLAISLGIIIKNSKVIIRSVKIFLTSFLVIAVVSTLTGLISNFNINDLGLVSVMKPSLYAFVVAIVAGFAASFTWAKPSMNSTLPGIAITVTLIPPLTAIGLAIASGNWIILRDVFNLLMINIFGIIMASLIIFLLMDFYKSKKKLIAEIKEEEKLIEKNSK